MSEDNKLRSYIRNLIQQEMLIIKDEESDYQKFFNAALKKFGVTSPDQLSDVKKKEFFDFIDANYQAKDETSSVSAMSGGDSYSTPHAFSTQGKSSDRATNKSKWKKVKDIDESVDFKNNELTPSRRMNQAVSAMRKSLKEINHLLNKSSKFRQEAGVTSDKYWVRTKSSLRKLSEDLITVMNKLNNLK